MLSNNEMKYPEDRLKQMKDNVLNRKKELLASLNYEVDEEYRWSLEEIKAFTEEEKRVIVFIYDSTQFFLYVCEVEKKDGELIAGNLIPVAWDFCKIGFSIYLSENIKEIEWYGAEL